METRASMTWIASAIVFLVLLPFNSLFISFVIALLVFALLRVSLENTYSLSSSSSSSRATKSSIKSVRNNSIDNRNDHSSSLSYTTSANVSNRSPLFKMPAGSTSNLTRIDNFFNSNRIDGSGACLGTTGGLVGAHRNRSDHILDGRMFVKRGLPRVSFANVKPTPTKLNAKKPCMIRLAPLPLEPGIGLFGNSNQLVPTLKSPSKPAVQKPFEAKAVVEALKSKRKRVLNESFNSNESDMDPDGKSKRQRNSQLNESLVGRPVVSSVRTIDAIPRRSSVKRGHQYLRSSSYQRPTKMFKNNEIISSYSSLYAPPTTRRMDVPQVLVEDKSTSKAGLEEIKENEAMDTRVEPKSLEETEVEMQQDGHSEEPDAKTDTPTDGPKDDQESDQVTQLVKKPSKSIYRVPEYLHSIEEHARDHKKDLKRLKRYINAIKETASPPPTPVSTVASEAGAAAAAAATITTSGFSGTDLISASAGISSSSSAATVPSLFTTSTVAPMTAAPSSAAVTVTTSVSAFAPITTPTEKPSLISNGIGSPGFDNGIGSSSKLNFQFSAKVPDTLKPTEQPKEAPSLFKFGESAALSSQPPPPAFSTLPSSIQSSFGRTNTECPPLVGPQAPITVNNPNNNGLSTNYINPFGAAVSQSTPTLQPGGFNFKMPQPIQAVQPTGSNLFTIGSSSNSSSSSTRETSRRSRYRK